MPTIAVSTSPTTRAGASSAAATLRAAGHGVRVFEADGVGGRELETAVAAGAVAGVLDFCLAELADELCGGAMSAGPDRLTAAGVRGVPQVVCPGGMDAIRLVDSDLRSGRRCVRDGLAYARTTPEECDALGKDLANRVCLGVKTTMVLLPAAGLSSLGTAEGPLRDAGADAALFQSFTNWVSPDVEVITDASHANDPDFTKAATKALVRLLDRHKR